MTDLGRQFTIDHMAKRRTQTGVPTVPDDISLPSRSRLRIRHEIVLGPDGADGIRPLKKSVLARSVQKQYAAQLRFTKIRAFHIAMHYCRVGQICSYESSIPQRAAGEASIGDLGASKIYCIQLAVRQIQVGFHEFRPGTTTARQPPTVVKERPERPFRNRSVLRFRSIIGDGGLPRFALNEEHIAWLSRVLSSSSPKTVLSQGGRDEKQY